MLFLPAKRHQMTLLSCAFSLSLSLLCMRPRSVFLTGSVLFVSSAAILPALLISIVLWMLSRCPFSIHSNQNPKSVTHTDMSIPPITSICPCGTGLSMPMLHRRKKLMPVVIKISPFFMSCPFVSGLDGAPICMYKIGLRMYRWKF